MKKFKLTLLIASLAICGFASLSVAANKEPIQPIQSVKVKDPNLVELGKKLYFDPRLSKSGFISCNSCHNLSMGGTDNLRTSIGHNWTQGPINAPTVLNSSLNLAQFWDGRAADLKAQAGGPIANPGEMASSHALAVDVLQSIPAYVNELFYQRSEWRYFTDQSVYPPCQYKKREPPFLYQGFQASHCHTVV